MNFMHCTSAILKFPWFKSQIVSLSLYVIDFSEKDLDSDEESSPAESEDDCGTIKRPETSGDRRKHQRLWTLSEVTKLVDGVSHYGVGRWTDIKRLLFSSSAYRTPVDLRVLHTASFS